MDGYEKARLAALRQLNLLNTPPSENFDRIVRMARQIYDLPIAAVSLTDKDRQWFKSRVGVEHWEIPRYKACCNEVTMTSDLVVINDLLASDFYVDSVLARSGIRFYAGAPLVTHDGFTLGSMCVLGLQPREASDDELTALQDCSRLVMNQIDLQHAVGRIDFSSGLPNYVQFIEDLDDLARDHPGQPYFAVGTELVDLSQLGSLQRVMGPTYLSELLCVARKRLESHSTWPAARKLYHIGPCQLVHLDTGTTNGVIKRAHQWHEALMTAHIEETTSFTMSPAFGIVPFRLGKGSPSATLRRAHCAARDARDHDLVAGIYSATSDALHRRSFNLLSDFGHAVQSTDQLHLVYQPRVTMATGACKSAEALLRWQHRSLGIIYPIEFVPLLEQTPMCRQLTDWVLRHALAQVGVWRRQGLDLKIAINVAAANLIETDFTDRVLAYMAAENLPLDCIELELTESGLLSNGRAAREQLSRLVDAGIHVAIDDFGTGYSSLAYLQDIPAHVVKIDRSFITNLEQHTRGQTLVKSMINMAHDLGYSVVAEGVETCESYQRLNLLDCDEAQGYLIAKPLSEVQFSRWFRACRKKGLFSAQSGTLLN
ncbi:sensor domain-containing phosphodiesterase [Allohahella marinimesophila]|uniref:EAL domain-containing protein n=1 Tax=Allohahella marinimesophila TaxID=1054972 RepID=A0ABP7PFP9_9GAMM